MGEGQVVGRQRREYREVGSRPMQQLQYTALCPACCSGAWRWQAGKAAQLQPIPGSGSASPQPLTCCSGI